MPWSCNRQSVRGFSERRQLHIRFNKGLRFSIPAVSDILIASSRDTRPVATMERLSRNCRKSCSYWYLITKRSVPPSLWWTCITAYCTGKELLRISITAPRPCLNRDRLQDEEARFGPNDHRCAAPDRLCVPGLFRRHASEEGAVSLKNDCPDSARTVSVKFLTPWRAILQGEFQNRRIYGEILNFQISRPHKSDPGLEIDLLAL